MRFVILLFASVCVLSTSGGISLSKGRIKGKHRQNAASERRRQQEGERHGVLDALSGLRIPPQPRITDGERRRYGKRVFKVLDRLSEHRPFCPADSPLVRLSQAFQSTPALSPDRHTIYRHLGSIVAMFMENQEEALKTIREALHEISASLPDHSVRSIATDMRHVATENRGDRETAAERLMSVLEESLRIDPVPVEIDDEPREVRRRRQEETLEEEREPTPEEEEREGEWSDPYVPGPSKKRRKMTPKQKAEREVQRAVENAVSARSNPPSSRRYMNVDWMDAEISDIINSEVASMRNELASSSGLTRDALEASVRGGMSLAGRIRPVMDAIQYSLSRRGIDATVGYGSVRNRLSAVFKGSGRGVSLTRSRVFWITNPVVEAIREAAATPHTDEALVQRFYAAFDEIGHSEYRPAAQTIRNHIRGYREAGCPDPETFSLQQRTVARFRTGSADISEVARVASQVGEHDPTPNSPINEADTVRSYALETLEVHGLYRLRLLDPIAPGRRPAPLERELAETIDGEGPSAEIGPYGRTQRAVDENLEGLRSFRVPSERDPSRDVVAQIVTPREYDQQLLDLLRTTVVSFDAMDSPAQKLFLLSLEALAKEPMEKKNTFIAVSEITSLGLGNRVAPGIVRYYLEMMRVECILSDRDTYLHSMAKVKTVDGKRTVNRMIDEYIDNNVPTYFATDIITHVFTFEIQDSPEYYMVAVEGGNNAYVYGSRLTAATNLGSEDVRVMLRHTGEILNRMRVALGLDEREAMNAHISMGMNTNPGSNNGGVAAIVLLDHLARGYRPSVNRHLARDQLSSYRDMIAYNVYTSLTEVYSQFLPLPRKLDVHPGFLTNLELAAVSIASAPSMREIASLDREAAERALMPPPRLDPALEADRPVAAEPVIERPAERPAVAARPVVDADEPRRQRERNALPPPIRDLSATLKEEIEGKQMKEEEWHNDAGILLDVNYDDSKHFVSNEEYFLAVESKDYIINGNPSKVTVNQDAMSQQSKKRLEQMGDICRAFSKFFSNANFTVADSIRVTLPLPNIMMASEELGKAQSKELFRHLYRHDFLRVNHETAAGETSRVTTAKENAQEKKEREEAFFALMERTTNQRQKIAFVLVNFIEELVKKKDTTANGFLYLKGSGTLRSHNENTRKKQTRRKRQTAYNRNTGEVRFNRVVQFLVHTYVHYDAWKYRRYFKYNMGIEREHEANAILGDALRLIRGDIWTAKWATTPQTFAFGKIKIGKTTGRGLRADPFAVTHQDLIEPFASQIPSLVVVTESLDFARRLAHELESIHPQAIVVSTSGYASPSILRLVNLLDKHRTDSNKYVQQRNNAKRRQHRLDGNEGPLQLEEQTPPFRTVVLTDGNYGGFKNAMTMILGAQSVEVREYNGNSFRLPPGSTVFAGLYPSAILETHNRITDASKKPGRVEQTQSAEVSKRIHDYIPMIDDLVYLLLKDSRARSGLIPAIKKELRLLMKHKIRVKLEQVRIDVIINSIETAMLNKTFKSVSPLFQQHYFPVYYSAGSTDPLAHLHPRTGRIGDRAFGEVEWNNERIFRANQLETADIDVVQENDETENRRPVRERRALWEQSSSLSSPMPLVVLFAVFAAGICASAVLSRRTATAVPHALQPASEPLCPASS